MKVQVDENICGGAGICIEICPEVFDLNDDGLSSVKVAVVPEGLEDACREAADKCPTNAIKVEE